MPTAPKTLVASIRPLVRFDVRPVLVVLLAITAAAGLMGCRSRTAPASPAQRVTIAPADTPPLSELPPATRVSLHLHDATPREALDALRAAAPDVEFDVSLPPAATATTTPAATTPAPPAYGPDWGLVADRRVTVDYDDTPLLVVLGDVCRQAGLQPGLRVQGDGTRSVTIAPPRRMPEALVESRRRMGYPIPDDQAPTGPAWGAAPRAVAGPFLVALTQTNHNRTRSYLSDRYQGLVARFASSPPHTRGFQFTVLADPLARVYSLGNLRVDDVLDRRGRSLIAPDNPWQAPGDVPSAAFGSSVSTSTGAGLLADAAGQTVRVRGSFTALLLRKTEKLEVGDVLEARGAEHTVGGVRVRVDGVRQTPDAADTAYELSLTVPGQGLSRESLEQLRSFLMNPDRAPRLLDADGRPLRRASAVARDVGDGLRLTARYDRRQPGALDDPGPPATLVWEFPTQTKEYRIPFEFDGIKLP